MRVMVYDIILLSACLPWLVTTKSVAKDGTWSEYDRKLKVFIPRKPVLLVLFKFPYELELFRKYPSQQIISGPPRLGVFKRCPFERILLLTTLDNGDFWKKENRGLFRLCPLGTAFYAINDPRIFVSFGTLFLPYFAPTEPMKKGLFYGVQLNLFNGDRPRELSLPSAWADERLKESASIVSIDLNTARISRRYDLLFEVGNYTLENIQFVGMSSAPNRYCRQCPTVGVEKPIIYSVYKPQALHVTQITDENFADDASKVTALAVGVTVAVMTWLSFPRQGITYAVFVTAASLIAAIPLNFTKPGVKLILALGFWLLLGQIFISIMKGELVKQASAGYQDRIRRIDACVDQYGELDESEGNGLLLAVPAHTNLASSRLLAYRAACLLDILEAQPFIESFQMKYPKAEVYPIKHSLAVNSQAWEGNFVYVGSDTGRFRRPMFGRAEICPFRGNFYLQRLLQADLFKATRYCSYWRKTHRKGDWSGEMDRPPNAAYSRHVAKLSEFNGSPFVGSPFVGTNVDLCLQVIQVGWLISFAIFVITVVSGRWRAIFDRVSRWLGSGSLTNPMRRCCTRIRSCNRRRHKKMARGGLSLHGVKIIVVRPSSEKPAREVAVLRDRLSYAGVRRNYD